MGSSANMHLNVHTQPFYGSLDFVQFVRDNPSEPVPEGTFTHSHLLWSSIIPYLLPPSTTINGILCFQFTCLTNLFPQSLPSFPWSTSWPATVHFIHHTFLHLLIHLFAAHAHTTAASFAEVPRLCHLNLVSLSTLYLAILPPSALPSAIPC